MSAAVGASGRWAFAVMASVLLHGAVLGFFFAPGCDVEPPALADEVEEAFVATNPPPTSVTDEESVTSVTSGEVVPPVPRSTRPVPVRPVVSPDDELPADYVVRSGDTLTKIARRFGMTPEELAKINGKPLRKMDVLWVGQKIKLRK